MSATIPENMLLSDLLKSTGYDCPDSLKDKTFDESTSGGGGEADLEANHASSVNVEEYTQPIEITPAEGKDGMEKVTLTLTNIPSSEGNQGYSVFLENGDSDGTIFSKIVCFGGATPVAYGIPAGTYDAFFVTDDVYEGEDHDFTDIPSLFSTPSNVSATRVGNMPRYYRVVISAEAQFKSSGEYGTQGRRALLTLFPVGV